MRGLFLRIFAIFWLAQSLIFVISTGLIVSQHFPNGGSIAEALDSTLRNNAEIAIKAYDAGGCPAFASVAGRFEPEGSALLDQEGDVICNHSLKVAVAGVRPHIADRIDLRDFNGSFGALVPETSKTGARYEYVWIAPPARHRPPPRRWQYWHFAVPQLPVAILVGGATTFVLVLFISRPLVRLRRAARKLAEGKLDVRVDQSPKQAAQANSDEFQGLVHDFNHMAERLESMVGAQKLLVRDISHELRSPLARLSVALELARDDAGPELETHLGRIERETLRLNQLIGQLLTLSAMEARDGAKSYDVVSLNGVCEKILPDAAYEAQQRPCRVELIQEGKFSIRGNQELLYRAIENVVRNAIRYTAPNTLVQLRLTGETMQGKSYAALEINDEGPGIPEAELTEIFRPFYRVDRARSSDTGGVGVGLAITDRAVRLHGGTIRASNREPAGTSVKMLFPLS
ncbi:two-component system, OmpR family, sensor histidine kinase CpxA [Bryocella elongata]|uniref:histidine kinase n=1 Tax=Bryocella elongata TaxID=863522 RepID=A0A1H6CGV5_9BACT|nr:ATP-binding protein [Bryocella elongata]SEG72240.1 two-component system, OmpR family, sensor histidine kinase CpxA [Bryocella elongata]